MKVITSLIIVASLMSGVAFGANGWTQANPIEMSTLQGAASVNGRFVVISRLGGALTSPDGQNWTLNLSAPKTLSGIESIDSLFVGVGEDGKIHTSLDGIAWVERYSGTAFKQLIRGHDKLVALASDGLVFSSNGINWVKHAADLSDVRALVWTGTQFVAAGYEGTVLTSPDGISWTKRPTGSTATIWHIGWTDSLLVALGNPVMTSPDGIAWTHRQSGPGGVTHLVWTGSRLIASSNPGYTSSEDGVTWSSVSPVDDSRFVAWTGGRVIVGGFDRSIWTSPDGLSNWTKGNVDRQPLPQSLRSIVWTGNRFLAVGDGAVTSPDGSALSWRAIPALAGRSLMSVAWSGDRLVVVGSAGLIFSSPDGVEWTDRTSPVVHSGGVQTGTTKNLTAVTWGGGQFVAVGAEGTILTSPDGSVWTVRNSGLTQSLRAVKFAAGRYVAVGVNGGIVTSSDGISWTKKTSGTTNVLKVIEWAGDRWVAVDSSGSWFCENDFTPCLYASSSAFHTSPDADVWSIDTVLKSFEKGQDSSLNAFIWTGSSLVGVGGSGRYVSTKDWENWKSANAMTSYPNRVSFQALALGGNRLVAVGAGGTIFTGDLDNVTPIRIPAKTPSRSWDLRYSRSHLTIRFPDAWRAGESRLMLYTVSGIKLSDTRSRGAPSVTLPIAAYPPGLYVVSVTGEDGVRLTRIFQHVR